MPDKPSKKIIFVAVRSYGLFSSRLLLIKHFISQGWEVVTASCRDKYTPQLEAVGARFVAIPFYRGGLSPFKDIVAVRALINLFKEEAPDVVHIYHSKPSILANIAARFIKKTFVVTTITGLGHSVTKGGMGAFLSTLGYKYSIGRSNKIVFLNPDDQEYFLKNGIGTPHKFELIVSSGVDTSKFAPVSKNTSNLRVLMAGRLIVDKGIVEYIKAAELLKKHYHNITFALAGEWDEVHPGAISKEWFDAAVQAGTIEFIGYVSNMAEELKSTDIFVLPSYGEGIPRVILEASASAIPVVTTDVNGCRSAVIDGVTGYLVRPKDENDLAEKIKLLVDNYSLRHKLGSAGRQWMNDNFDIKAIAQKYISLYERSGIDI